MNVLTHKDIVLKLLKAFPHLRDNDNKLVANIWNKHLIDAKIDTHQLTAFELLKLFSDGELPSFDSITRIRRKLQEEFKELQGEKWAERHKESVKVIKQIRETPDLYAGGTP